jgi:CMP-N-acetylneuraminic acid synthetase
MCLDFDMSIPSNTPSAVAIIPARGGSKRIPRKNLVTVLNKPLIGWVIETALRSEVFEQVIVSSEDAEILEASQAFGATAYQRPPELADDYTHVGPVIEDCVCALEIRSETVCLLFATALLLRVTHLQGAARMLSDPKVASVLAIAEFESPPQRAYAMAEDQSIAMAQPEYFHWRSQDLPKRYRDAGMFSWWKREPGQGSPRGFIIPKTGAVDIDTHEDLDLARAIFAAQRAGGLC